MRRSGKSGHDLVRGFLPLTLTELFRSRTLHSINPHTLITNHAARESLPSPSPRPSPLGNVHSIPHSHSAQLAPPQASSGHDLRVHAS